MAARKNILHPLWFAVPDLAWMLAALYLALLVKYGDSLTQVMIRQHYSLFFPIFLLWLFLMFVHNLFDAKSMRRYITLLFSLTSCAVFCFLAAVLYFYFQPHFEITPRRFLLLVTGIWFAVELAWRLFLKSFLQNRITEEYWLISPSGELDELHKEFLAYSYLGLHVDKYISDLNDLAALDRLTANIIVAERLLDNPQQARLIYDLRRKGAKIFGQLEFSERLLRRVPLAHVTEAWFLRNVFNHENRIDRILRRAVDLVAGLLLGLIFAVTFPVIALAIKFNSRGPLFFVQDRVGQFGETFRVYKYRTMAATSSGRGWTSVNDPRITAVGRFLRRTHLDELPQFINLLAGHMSLVGPRPEQVAIVEELNRTVPFYHERHLAKPGMTGWAQLNIYAGSLEETKTKHEYDLYYLKHRSFLFDLEIILKTLYAIVANKLA
jgi:exopolysaccharide biosynthesis polyprenyl glycosylphosphotransferase